MSLSKWLCKNSSPKKRFVKIVYPGGRAELHDRPVVAADIMLGNPKCCVAHPHVFQKPWAVVEPEAVLMPGQKFYIVPISTVRKLQRLSLRYSPIRNDHSTPRTDQDSVVDCDRDGREEFFSDHVKYCFFWLLRLKKKRAKTKGTSKKKKKGSPKHLEVIAEE